MTRFVTSDLTAAAEAAAALPAAMRRYVSAVTASRIHLDDVPAAAPASHVLRLLATETVQQKSVKRARAEVLLLLANSGVPVRQIAEAMGMHHATVTKQIRDALGEQAAAAAKAEQIERTEEEAARAEADRARQEREAREYADRVDAARREGR